jgi:hypothetical protein
LQSRVSDSAVIDKPERRRFPPPWSVEETDACFIVKDRNGAKACLPKKLAQRAGLGLAKKHHYVFSYFVTVAAMASSTIDNQSVRSCTTFP